MKSKELIKLQKEWYKKLEEDGFVDIERFNPRTMEPDDILKRSTQAFIDRVQDKIPATSQYYRCASYLLHSGKVLESHLKVWELYCEGNSYREISAQINISFRQVRKIINLYLPELQYLINEDNESVS